MDDLAKSIVPLRRTVDDGVDEAESLPFRYGNLIQMELPVG
jgi:hypothetical protein